MNILRRTRFSLGQLLLMVPVGMVGALVFGWSGVFNVGATSGHWPITSWFIHFVMQQSVGFRAEGDEQPNLADPALIRRGAAHYEIACAMCHGSPAAPRSPTILQMQPPPPDLESRIDEWEPPELFWIVKHGIKFTGMPAWPAAERDDEVWSVVAFLETLPSLSADEYRTLAFGDLAAHEGVASNSLGPASLPALETCIRCHGTDGRGDANGAFPRLDLQSETYLRNALHAYRYGQRPSGIMETAVSGLSDAKLTALASYYSTAADPTKLQSPIVSEPQLLARGAELSLKGDPAAEIGACSGCHFAEARAEFPRLNGQYAEYLKAQLELFASEAARGGGRFSNLMETAAHNLEPTDIRAAALWFSSQPAFPR